MATPFRVMVDSFHFYHNAAQLLCVVSSGITSLKNAFYNQQGPVLWK